MLIMLLRSCGFHTVVRFSYIVRLILFNVQIPKDFTFIFLLAVLDHCSKSPFPMGRVRFHVFKFYYSLYSNDFTSDQN